MTGRSDGRLVRENARVRQCVHRSSAYTVLEIVQLQPLMHNNPFLIGKDAV
jgi:hypothetical protein